MEGKKFQPFSETLEEGGGKHNRCTVSRTKERLDDDDDDDEGRPRRLVLTACETIKCLRPSKERKG